MPAQVLPVSATALGVLPGTAPYSLTDYVVINAQSSTTGNSLDSQFSSTVPDGGATVTLLGTALAGLGLMGSFFKRR